MISNGAELRSVAPWVAWCGGACRFCTRDVGAAPHHAAGKQTPGLIGMDVIVKVQQGVKAHFASPRHHGQLGVEKHVRGVSHAA